MRDRFFVRVLHGTLPLWIWATHFFVTYALVAARCTPAAGVAPESSESAILLLLTGASLAICLILLWRAVRRWRATVSTVELHELAAVGSAVLAVAGIAWAGIPVLMLGGCR